MNEYCFQDLTVGLTEQFEVQISEEMVDAFVRLSGDINPLHATDDHARALGFPHRVVHGLLSATLLSRLAGGYLPGKHCLLHGVRLEFVSPVYIGDCLTVRGTVSQLNVAYRQVTLKVDIYNQNQQLTCRGKLQAAVQQ